MMYNIKFSKDFIKDLTLACSYLSNCFGYPRGAQKLINNITKKLELLSVMPWIYPIIGKSNRLKNEYRKILIDNYVLLYTIDVSEKTIYISHLYYSRKNYLNGLI